MIQRIQTVFLAIVAIGMGVVASTTIWTKIGSNTAEAMHLNALSLEYSKNGTVAESTPTFYILGFAIIAAVLAVYSLISFKNRKLQMLLGAINSMVIAVVMGFIFYYIFKTGAEKFNANIAGNYGMGFYAGGVALLANMLSNRFIRRDENLVRSADRMR
jgi:glucan phosphoethanolaminetransferase (alkaline phosphatase superfamily)